MLNVKIGPRHQITIPHEVVKKLKLGAGEFLELDIEDERIVLTPAQIIPKDQAWFHTKEWQKKFKEAEEDVKEGRLSGHFETAGELLKHLKNQDEDTND